MKSNPRNNYIMLDSFVVAMERCDDMTKLEAFQAYRDYYVNGKEYEGENNAVYLLISSHYYAIDSVKKSAGKNGYETEEEKQARIHEARVENGKKGGRPSNEEKANEKLKKAKKANEANGTREEKKREENKREEYTPLTPQGEPRGDDPLFDNPDVESEFDNYLEMRKKKKKPATDRAVELARKHLRELSGGDPVIAVAILQQSIINSWTDIYELSPPRETARSGTGNSNNKWEQIRELEKELANEKTRDIGDN